MVSKLCVQVKSNSEHIYRNNHLSFLGAQLQQECGICITKDFSIEKLVI